MSLFNSLQQCTRHVSKCGKLTEAQLAIQFSGYLYVGQNSVSSCCSARVANLPSMNCRFARTAFLSASSSFPLRNFGLWSRGQGLRVQGIFKATGFAWCNRLQMQISADAAGAGAGVWRGGGMARQKKACDRNSPFFSRRGCRPSGF